MENVHVPDAKIAKSSMTIWRDMTMTDSKQILVPVDPACVPDGYEAVRVRLSEGGSIALGGEGYVINAVLEIRKRWQPHPALAEGVTVYRNHNEWKITDGDVKPCSYGFVCGDGCSSLRIEKIIRDFVPPPHNAVRITKDGFEVL
jgi:hypothetical protein